MRIRTWNVQGRVGDWQARHAAGPAPVRTLGSVQRSAPVIQPNLDVGTTAMAAAAPAWLAAG